MYEILVLGSILTPAIWVGIKLNKVLGIGYTDDLAKHFNYTYEVDGPWKYDADLYLNAFGKEVEYERGRDGKRFVGEVSEFVECDKLKRVPLCKPSEFEKSPVFFAEWIKKEFEKNVCKFRRIV